MPKPTDIEGSLRANGGLEVEEQDSDEHWTEIERVAGDEVSGGFDLTIDVSAFDAPAEFKIKAQFGRGSTAENLEMTFNSRDADGDYSYVERSGATFTEVSESNTVQLINLGGVRNTGGEWKVDKPLNGRVPYYGNGEGRGLTPTVMFSGTTETAVTDMPAEDLQTIDIVSDDSGSNEIVTVLGREV